MKNLLIIGASSGIGHALSIRLHTTHQIIGVSRNTPPRREIFADYYLSDVLSDDTAFYNQLPPALHGLVYCPGSIVLKPFHRMSDTDFLQVFQRDVLGAVRAIRHCIDRLKAANGAGVVVFSSVAAQTGMPFHSAVGAGKGALEGLMRSLAAEYAGSGIRFNALAPSLTHTPLAASLLNTADKQEMAARRHPLGRIGAPDEMAAAAAFLLSDEGSWVTGQVLGIDGGIGKLKT